MTEKKEEKTKKSILRDQRIFVRLTTEEFLELKTRASSNHRKVSEFVRETDFADKWVKLNDDWHLYDAIRSTNNDLNRLGNYLIHLTNILENKENSQEALDAVKELQKQVHDAITVTDKAKRYAHKAVFGDKYTDLVDVL